MPIASSDIKQYLSGGSGNTDPNASLGGAISTTEITDNVDNNLFDDVSGSEATAGDTEYRGIYFKNTHASLTLQSTKIWIETQTTSSNDAVAIALPGEGLNATIETIANESTAPSGETFSAPASYAAGLSMGNIPNGQYYGLWVRRVVDASASAYTANSFQLKIQGETAA